MSQRQRVALVGLGAAAKNWHTPACALANGVQLTAGVDPDAAARAAELDRPGIPIFAPCAFPGQ